MTRLRAAILMSACVATAFAATAAGPAAPSGGARVVVKSAVGDAECISPDGRTRAALRVGLRIAQGWDVRTGPESGAELSFESGTVLRLGENSYVTLSDTLAKTQKLGQAGRKDSLCTASE